MVVIDLTTKQTDNNPFSNKSNHPTITYIDSQQNIWISDFNEGLRCYTPNKKLIKHYTTSNSQLNNNIILCIKEINHKIWVGTDGGGINIINPITDEIEILQHVSGNTHSLPFNTITCLSSSENNSIWAGSTRRGFINIRKVPITTYSEVVLRNNMGLSERSILSMWHTPSDSLVWLGTDGGGVNSFNVNNHSFRHFTNTWGSKVVSMCDLSKDKLIISLFSKVSLFSTNIPAMSKKSDLIIKTLFNLSTIVENLLILPDIKQTLFYYLATVSTNLTYKHINLIL